MQYSCLFVILFLSPTVSNIIFWVVLPQSLLAPRLLLQRNTDESISGRFSQAADADTVVL